MRHKEKAKELFDKFLPLVQGGYLNETYHTKAKQCALIAVYMHLEELEDIEFNYDIILGVEKHFFDEVKAEIEKL